MKQVTIYLDTCDYDLIKSISHNSTFFFKKCHILVEHTTMPFSSVAIMFTPTRLIRRPLIAMIKDLVCAIADGNENKELLCSLIYRFMFYLG